MNREDKYILGCLFAIHQLQASGSKEFVTKVDGELEQIPWDDICKWIGDPYVKESAASNLEKLEKIKAAAEAEIID